MIDAWTPFLATEHNEVNWTPRRVRSLRPAAGRIDRFYAMGPAARQFAVNAGCGLRSSGRHARRSRD